MAPEAAERVRRWRHVREQGWNGSFASDVPHSPPQPLPLSLARNFTRLLGANTASATSLEGQQVIAGAYGEWFGSPLHAAYIRSIQQAKGETPKEILMRVLQGDHAELRGTVEASEAAGESLVEGGAEQLVELLEPLWRELEVPEECKMAMRQSSSELEPLLKHARELLALRDATVLVMNGLHEHERLMAQVQEQAEPLEEESPLARQFQRIDGALAHFMATWGRRFVAPPWLDVEAPGPSASDLPPATFQWRGVDALAQIRRDGNALRQRDAGASLTEGLAWRRLPTGGPQHSANRAALNDARGLRSMLRGAGSSGFLSGSPGAISAAVAAAPRSS